MMIRARLVLAAGKSQTISPISQPADPPVIIVCQNGSAVVRAAIWVMAWMVGSGKIPRCYDGGEHPGRCQVGDQHDGPDPKRQQESGHVTPGQHRDDRGQSGFGEELLASEDDDQEADRITEVGYQVAPWRIGKMCLQGCLREERKADRQAGSDTGPRQAVDGAIELLLTLVPDDFVDDQGTHWRSGSGLTPLFLVQMRRCLASFGHNHSRRRTRALTRDLGPRWTALDHFRDLRAWFSFVVSAHRVDRSTSGGSLS
jgi:hypothetical protein